MSSLAHAWSDCRRGWPGRCSGNYPDKQVRIAVPTNKSALSDFPCMVIAGSGENLWTGLPAMRNLTSEGQAKIAEIAQRHSVSTDGVLTMLDALQRGGGTMAQFSHPDFGGSGQWMRGGMTMVSDLFNNALKAKVDGVCNDLSYLLGGDLSWFQEPVQNSSFSSSGSFGNYGPWWPQELGQPNSSGGQNDIRYAYFGHANRLAVDMGGTVTVYDTGDHVISGVSQQQGNGWTLTFSSQYGTVPISSLRVVSGNAAQSQSSARTGAGAGPFQSPAPVHSQSSFQSAEPFGPISLTPEGLAGTTWNFGPAGGGFSRQNNPIPGRWHQRRCRSARGVLVGRKRCSDLLRCGWPLYCPIHRCRAGANRRHHHRHRSGIRRDHLGLAQPRRGGNVARQCPYVSFRPADSGGSFRRAVDA